MGLLFDLTKQNSRLEPHTSQPEATGYIFTDKSSDKSSNWGASG